MSQTIRKTAFLLLILFVVFTLISCKNSAQKPLQSTSIKSTNSSVVSTAIQSTKEKTTSIIGVATAKTENNLVEKPQSTIKVDISAKRYTKYKKYFGVNFVDKLFDNDGDNVINEKIDELYPYTRTEGDFCVSDYKEGVSINAYYGTSKNVVIPEKIDGKPVIQIAGQFSYSDDEVVEEPYYKLAFEDCEIESLTLPWTLKEIYATSSGALQIKSLKRIDVSKYNPYYKSVDGVLFTKNKKVLLCFPSNYAKQHYKIPTGVEEIDQYACYFSNPNKTYTFVIPKTLIYMDNAENLPAFEVQKDNPYYFALDGSLYNKNQTQLEQYNPYSNATTFEFPDTVTEMQKYCAFPSFGNKGANKLKKIIISKNIKTIKFEFFDTFRGLESYIVLDGNVNFSSLDGALLNKDQSQLIAYPINKSDQTYRVPKSVTSFKTGAFWGSKNLKTLIIGKNVKKIIYNNECWGFTVKGYQGTAAEKFAKRCYLDFIEIKS